MKIFRTAACVAASIIIAACGGGGGGSSTPQQPPTSISLDKTALTFAAGSQSEAASDPGQTVVATFKGDGVVVGTLPGQTLPNWLTVSAASVQSSPASVLIRITGVLLPPGRYSTVLRFASGNANLTNVVYQDVTVTYTFDHVISPATSIVRGYAGTTSPPHTASLSVTTTNASWQATTSTPWLTVSPSSGTGNGNITVTANAGALTEGEYIGTVLVTDKTTNRSRTMTVTFEVDQGGLDLSTYALAFVDTSRITTPKSERRMNVIVNLPGSGAWTATSDVPWLSVTPGFSGTANIGIVASSTGLSDGLYYGKITFNTNTDPVHPSSAVARVGFYVDHTNAVPTGVVSSPDLGNVHSIIADPIRPYFYVSNSTAMISVVHAYSGAVVDSITIPGGDLRQMEISPDGSYLYVANAANSSVVPITLDTRTAGMAWTGMRFHVRSIDPMTQLNDGLSLKYAHISGLTALMTGERQLLSTTNGAILIDFNDSVPAPTATAEPFLATAWDGTALYMSSHTTGTYEFVRYKTSNRNGVLKVQRSNTWNNSGDAAGLLLLPDTDRLMESANNRTPAVVVYDGLPTMYLLGGYQINGPLQTNDMDFALTQGILLTSSASKTITQYDELSLAVRGTPHSFTDTPLLARFSGDEQRIGVAVQNGSGSQLQVLDAAP